MKVDELKSRLKPGVHAHLVGVGGVSMAPLAEVLCGMGIKVTGSDRQESATLEHLRRVGVQVQVGQCREHVQGAELVIRTAAAHDDNPEIAAARAEGIPVYERAQAWGALMTDYANALCISGTHGKTTTTSMCTHIAMAAQTDPTVMIGGTLPLLGGCHRVGKGDTIILESCEYCNSFLSFRPTVAVILDIEADHLDFFKDLNDIRSSFRTFAQLVPPTGAVIANAEDENVCLALEGVDRPLITFGLERGDVTCRGLVFHRGLPEFDVIYAGEVLAHIALQVPGTHNVKNALAACAASVALGFGREAMEQGLAAFRGAGRRFEHKGEYHGAQIYDDYAHHPGEIHALLDAVKGLGYQRVICAFQPHTYSRTIALFDDFVRELGAADVAILAEIYAARETNDTGLSSSQLAQRIPGAKYCATLEELTGVLAEMARPGDLILTVGAGDIYTVGEKLAAYGQK